MKIFKMEFKRGFKSLMLWTGVCAALTVLFTLLYPSMLDSDMLALFNAKLASLPKEFVDAFHLSGEDITQLPNFFALMFQFVLMAACVHGAMLGLNALSKEESEGTIEFLYAKPVSRIQIVSSKLANAAVSFMCFFAAISIAGIVAGMCVRPADLDLMDMTTAFKSILLGGMISGFTYLLLGFAVSVLLKKAKHAASMAVMLFFLTYIVGNIPSMTGVLDFLKWVSPMNYFLPSEVVTTGIDGTNVLISVLIMGASAALTYTLYRRRNFYI
jgi:ABC-2 type transport system permease protein